MKLTIKENKLKNFNTRSITQLQVF